MQIEHESRECCLTQLVLTFQTKGTTCEPKVAYAVVLEAVPFRCNEVLSDEANELGGEVGREAITVCLSRTR
jgi:hypothetical protein